MSVCPRAEKFNIVSKDHGRTHKCDFFVFDRKYPFQANLVKKKNQNGTFKLKFGTQTNLNVQNSMMMFNFSVFDWKYTFWANLVQKIEIGFLSQRSTNHMTEREGREHSFNFSLPLLPASQTLRHCPGNYCWELISVLDEKHRFSANLDQKSQVLV